MTRARPTFSAGSNVFLEHILFYETQEEKGVAASPPIVQLGGGAYNMLKTLHALGVSEKDTSLVAFSGREPSAQNAALSFLLSQESMGTVQIPILSRPFSSYYLVPKKGNTWAFGDRRQTVSKLSTEARMHLTRAGGADIKMATEPIDSDEAVEATVLLLKKYKDGQRSVLIPSRGVLSSKRLLKILPHVDLLSMNRSEAKALFRKGINDRALLAHPVPYLFITDGGGEALLKAEGAVYRMRPKKVARAKYPGGAGDAATAALAYALFARKALPEHALEHALSVGREVLSVPTPYLPKA